MLKLERYFQILELKPGASFADVKDSWRILSQVWHPDKHPQGSRVQARAVEKQKQINDAYDQLKKWFEGGGSLSEYCYGRSQHARSTATDDAGAAGPTASGGSAGAGGRSAEAEYGQPGQGKSPGGRARGFSSQTSEFERSAKTFWSAGTSRPDLRSAHGKACLPGRTLVLFAAALLFIGLLKPDHDRGPGAASKTATEIGPGSARTGRFRVDQPLPMPAGLVIEHPPVFGPPQEPDLPFPGPSEPNR